MRHFNGCLYHQSWIYAAANSEEPDTNRFTPPCSVLQSGMLMLITKRGVVASSSVYILVFHIEQCNYDLHFTLTWARTKKTEAIQQWLQTFGGIIEGIDGTLNQGPPKSKTLQLQYFVLFSCGSLIFLGGGSFALLLPVLDVVPLHQISYEERIPLF